MGDLRDPRICFGISEATRSSVRKRDAEDRESLPGKAGKLFFHEQADVRIAEQCSSEGNQAMLSKLGLIEKAGISPTAEIDARDPAWDVLRGCQVDTLQAARDAVCDILPIMQITLAQIGARAAAKDECDPLVRKYLERCGAFARLRTQDFKSEEALLEWLARLAGRTPVTAVLLDSRGRAMSSETFAEWLRVRRDEGAQHLVFAVGPADGWSEEARARATLLLSLGPMTLAHSLARLVMAEQIYRAFTILAGHPYHGGH